VLILRKASTRFHRGHHTQPPQSPPSITKTHMHKRNMISASQQSTAYYYKSIHMLLSQSSICACLYVRCTSSPPTAQPAAAVQHQPPRLELVPRLGPRTTQRLGPCWLKCLHGSGTPPCWQLPWHCSSAGTCGRLGGGVQAVAGGGSSPYDCLAHECSLGLTEPRDLVGEPMSWTRCCSMCCWLSGLWACCGADAVQML